jgi:hypothetical protein
MTEIERITMEAAKKIDSGEKSNNRKRQEKNIANKRKNIIHTLAISTLWYNKKAIHKTYSKKLLGIDGFYGMTVCFSRQKKLRKLLTISVLKWKGTAKMSAIIEYQKGD